MKKQEIRVYTVLLITNDPTIALCSYTNRKEANTYAKKSAEAWGDKEDYGYTYSVDKRGLATASYIYSGEVVATYKVVETQLFI